MALAISPHIVSVPAEEGVVLYHTWFGNPLFVSPHVAELVASNDIEKLTYDQEQFSLLLEAGVLVEDTLDESEVFQSSVAKHAAPAQCGEAVSKLDLIVSQRCNLGCAHCIYFAGNERSFTPNTLMSYEVAQQSWHKYLTRARENGVSKFQVHFGGAEPLLNWDLVSRVLHDFQRDIRSEESIDWSINTNLISLEESMAKVLAAHGVAVHTSLDGGPDANDAIRVDLAGNGTFDRIWTKIELLREHGVQILDISTTLTSRNFYLFRVLPFVSWMEKHGIRALGIDIDLVGSPEISLDEAVETLVRIYWESAKRGIEVSGTWLTPFLNIVNRDVRQEHVAFCGAVKGHNLSVSPSGDVTLCSYMATRVGSVFSWNDLFDERGQFAKLVHDRQPGRDPHCSGCHIEGHCGGQCHVSREVGPRMPGLLDRMCDFYRSVTKRMLVCHASGEYVAPPESFPISSHFNRETVLASGEANQ